MRRYHWEWEIFDIRRMQNFFVLPMINVDWWDGYKVVIAWLFWGVSVELFVERV